jgi:O-antigen/teichoic acid export membrane protein
MAAPGYQVLFGLGRVRALAALGLVGSMLSLGLIRLLAPTFHLVGAAAGNFGYLIVLGANVAAGRHIGIPIRELARELWPALALVLAAALTGAADPGLASRAAATLVLVASVAWLSFGNGRAKALHSMWRGAPAQ